MSDNPTAERARSGAPGWWLVFTRELKELWIGGRALNLLILYSILMGATSFLIATNAELELIPPREVAYLMLWPSIAFALFIGLIIGADSISGERERGTLEALLLTPTSRRQIVIGKFLAAASPWPAALTISLVLVRVLSQGDEVFVKAVFWGSLIGSVLALAFIGLGMLVSFWSNSNRTSLFVSLLCYFGFLLPTQFPGEAQAGSIGQLIKKVNPMEAGKEYLARVIVNNGTPDELWVWALAPLTFLVVALGVLFFYAGPGLRLEGGRSRPNLANWSRAGGVSAIAGLLVAGLVTILAVSPVAARGGDRAPESELPIAITIDKDFASVKTGDNVKFTTEVAYSGNEESPRMVVAMNIIDIEGEVVDPEDWSPQRTQVVEPLPAGETATQSWVVNAIQEGDFMVYMVAVPEPDSEEATSQPVSTSGIHLTVDPFYRLSPGGVLPFAIGIPIALIATAFLLRWLRRRGLDTGAA